MDPNSLLLSTSNDITQLIAAEEIFLQSLENTMITEKLNSQNRSIKQIVGHLIDSASNNLHRIVHLQYNECPLHFPNYSSNGNNDRWIAIQHYQNEDWTNLTQLFKFINLHLAHVIECVDLDKMDNTWIAAEGEEVSLREMITDYPRHLKLHISEIHQLTLE